MRTRWERNVRFQRGLTPEMRLLILDVYLAADRDDRISLLKCYRITWQTAQQWATVYYGEGLRALRRQLGLPSQ